MQNNKKGLLETIYGNIEKLIKAKDEETLFCEIRDLLFFGGSLGTKNDDGKTLLMTLIEAGNSRSTLKFLNKFGVDVNATDTNGKTAIMYAIEQEDKEVFDALLSYLKTDLNAADNQGKTVSMYAAEKGFKMKICSHTNSTPQPTTQRQNG